MNKLLNKIYREKTEISSPAAIKKNLDTLNSELDQWQNALPQHLKISPADIGRDSTALPSPHVYLVL